MLNAKNTLVFILSCLVLFCASAITAVSQANEIDIKAVALFNGKAMLSINGGKAKIIKQGEMSQGVTLISSSTEQAKVKVGDTIETIGLNGALLLNSSLGSKPVAKEFIQLWSDRSGFFYATGSVGNRSARFLVDTGANLVVFSGQQARSLGIDYVDGVRSFASTASGVTPMYAISIEELEIDGLRLRNVDAGVIEGSFPQVPLLGMSFLGRLNMQQTGNQMILRKR